MIQIAAKSFGYGARVGVTCTKEGYALLGPIADKQGSALIIPFVPNIETFNELARTKAVEFLIVPICSYYSHLATAIWSSTVPTMAIQYPLRLPLGVTVLADFDRELILVPETESEAEEFRSRVRDYVSTSQTMVSGTRAASGSPSAISVLAEAASAGDVLRAIADGADGLSVVKAERLFGDMSGNSLETRNFISAVRANPQVLPLPVRFFDPDEEISNGGRLHVPHRCLGYRGVRILEVDETWLQRFIVCLELLDLEQVVVVLPMVTAASELRLFRERIGQNWDFVGVTVETPAAAMGIEELLEVSDFIEIGLNDLTQYTMAWDRDVPNEVRLPTDRIAEPVAVLVASVATACAAAGVPYTLGMDLRPSESLIAQLLRLGITSISCSPSLIKPWKNLIASQLSCLSRNS